MPYPGIPKNMTKKMEDCVKKVCASGRSKDSAIAICHDSIMGKKELEWTTMTDDQVENAVDEVLTEADDKRKEVKAREATHKKGWVPYGVTSFAELADYRAAQDAACEMSNLTDDFTSMVQMIVASDLITDKAAAIRSLSDELTNLLQQEVTAVDDAYGDGTTKANADPYPPEPADETDAQDMNPETANKGEKAVLSTEARNKLPDSAFLYIDAKGEKHLPYKHADGSIDLAHLRNAIARIPQMKGLSSTKKASLQARARKLLANANKELGIEENPDLITRIASAVKSVLGAEEEQPVSSPMMIWKEESGEYRWLARYSNNFRDNDNPPEIISKQSHERFVDMVDKGAYPLPELWLWHVKEWKCGQATSVAYDDNGFAVAAGYFDKGKEEIAEWLSKQKNVAVSHAMPPSSLVRDTADRSVIVQHQTVEISPLPMWAAANKLTGFVVLDALKEADMAIPQKKREAFINEWGMSPALLDKLEKQNAQDAQNAKEEGRESKETKATEPVKGQVETEQVAASEQVAQDKTEVPADKQTKENDPLDQSPSRREIADAFGSIISELKEMIEALSTQVTAIDSEVKELKKVDDDKVAEKAARIPAASLSALIAQRAIGRPETAVDGRSSLAKDKPKEASDAVAQTGIPFIDQMITGKK